MNPRESSQQDAAPTAQGSRLWTGFGPSCSVAAGLVHATDWPAYAPRSKRRTVATVCGRKRARLLGIPVVTEDGKREGDIALYWPPYVADIAADGLRRCPECMAARPGKPSRPEGPLVGFGR